MGTVSPRAEARRAGGCPPGVSAIPPGPAPRRGPAPSRSALRAAGGSGPPGRPAGSAPSSAGSRSDAGLGPLRPWPHQAPGKFGAAERQRRAAGPMEARGELGSGRESAGGDLLLALLARREDLRRGGCPGSAAAPGRADHQETWRVSLFSGPGYWTHGTRAEVGARAPARPHLGAPAASLRRGLWSCVVGCMVAALHRSGQAPSGSKDLFREPPPT